jgi:hypothetical protein
MPPQYSKSDAPYANVTLVKQQAPENEILQIGPLKLEVLEDGSGTDRRLSAVYIYVPPRTPGPPQHWHQVRLLLVDVNLNPPTCLFTFLQCTGGSLDVFCP